MLRSTGMPSPLLKRSIRGCASCFCSAGSASLGSSPTESLVMLLGQPRSFTSAAGAAVAGTVARPRGPAPGVAVAASVEAAAVATALLPEPVPLLLPEPLFVFVGWLLFELLLFELQAAS